MDPLAIAVRCAAEAHEGQTDKAGEPYVLHPLRLMMQMDTDDERMVAVLHDVVEDGPNWSLGRLISAGIPGHVVSMVEQLTRKRGQSYEGYIAGIEAPISRKVKIADLRDNMDATRLAKIASDPGREERMTRYHAALAKLLFAA